MPKMGFVTVTLSNHWEAQGPTSTSSSLLAPSDIGFVWRTNYSIEEVSLYVASIESQPIAIVVEDSRITQLTGVLKQLVSCSCIGVTVKTQRQQVSKLIRKGVSHNQGILVVAPETVLFAQSCLPQNIKAKTLLHIEAVNSYDQWRKRASLLMAQGAADGPDFIKNVKTVGKQIVMVSLKDSSPCTCTYPFAKNLISSIQSRIAVAKKLFDALNAANDLWGGKTSKYPDEVGIRSNSTGMDVDAEEEKRRGLVGKIEALRAKLKILESAPLSGVNANSGSTTLSLSSFKGETQSQSHKCLRSKMQILGLIHVPNKVELEKQASSGRALAVTKWIDGISGEQEGLPWGENRYGASADSCSKQVREVVEGFRDYVDKKAGRKLPKREQEVNLASNRLKKELGRKCRIVGFGWRPSPYGDEEQWGGKFGKCCAHNEVAMFFSRPWKPQEVLNTHVCSLRSPAPGNEGHDGCMEFLRAQCLFHSRPFTIWDDKHFHFIDSRGIITSFEKQSLLTLDKDSLKMLILNLRAWTIECEGTRAPREMINEIIFTSRLASNNFLAFLPRESPLAIPKVSKIVVSYLLLGYQ